MRWLFGAVLSCIVFAAVASSTFVPLRDSGSIDYLFAWPGAYRLAIAASLAVALAAALFIITVTLAGRRSDEARRLVHEGRWLAPLVLLAFSALGILPAVPGIGEHASPLAYFFHDLRWWWLAVLGGWTLFNADRILGSPTRRRLALTATWSTATRLLIMDAVVFWGVMGWAIATTPSLRFTGVLHGDEPKYIRYCEVWYQGGGLEISGKTLFADEPLDASPHLLTTAALLPRTIVEESAALLADLRQFVRHPLTFRWARVTGGGGFVLGKHGGIYEVYQPGLSVVLFPGYFIDRYLLGLHPGYQGEFPDELVMTNIVMLLVYGFCGVGLFRLLRHLLESDALAVLWAFAGVLTLPTSAFAFQFYPELVALLILLTVSTFLVTSPDRLRPFAAVAAGILTGALAWLHPRFLLLSLAIVAIAVLRMRARARTAFLLGYGLLVLSVMGFDYRVTGSWVPTARWDAANTGGTIRGLAVPINLVGYLFDRTWGLLPHCLLLLAVTPGLVVLARRSPWRVAALLAFGFALGIPAAGHSLSAAAGTPGRLVLAVVPLFIWPVAASVRRFWSSPTVRRATVVLAVVSLDAALSYNWTHKKHLGPMHAQGMSGWKPNVMFPNVSLDAADWTAASIAVFGVLILMITVVSILASRHDRPGPRPPDNAVVPRGWIPGGSIAAVPLVFLILTAITGRWYQPEYLIDNDDAHRIAAHALVNLERCRVCFTSREGPVDWTSLNPNRVDAMTVDFMPERHRLAVRVRLVGRDDRTARFGRIHVDFGDGGRAGWSGIVDEGHYEHEYRSPGIYSVVTWLQLRDGRSQLNRRTIKIGEAQSGG